MAQKICELPLTPIQESTQWLYAKKKKKILNLQPEMISVLPDLKIWSEMLTTTLFSGHWARHSTCKFTKENKAWDSVATSLYATDVTRLALSFQKHW